MIILFLRENYKKNYNPFGILQPIPNLNEIKSIKKYKFTYLSNSSNNWIIS